MNLAKRLRKLRKRNRKVAKARRRKVHFEPLEPRFLLSADLDPAIAAMLSNGMDQLETDVDNFFNDSTELDTPLPLINQVIGESFEDAQKVAPTILDLLAIDVDLNGDGSISGADETTLNSWDNAGNNDDKVDFVEFLEASFIDKIQEELDLPPASTDPADFATWLETNLDTSFTSSLPPDVMDYIGSVELDVSATNESNDNQVAFAITFDLTATKELPMDLGREADGYGLSFPEAVEVEASVNFTVDLGVLTSGETPVQNDDLFLDLELTAGALAEIDPFNVQFNMGFLGLETFNNSSITLDAEITATLDDPTTPTTIGFAESQFGNTSTIGTITANNVPSTFNPDHDVEFILRIGDSDAKTVKVTDTMTNGNTTISHLEADINTALGTAGLGTVIDADSTGGKIRLSVVDNQLDLDTLGFGSSEFTSDGSPVMATGAPTFDTAVDFVIVVDHGTPKLISIAGASDVDGIVSQLNTALTGTGVTASNVDPPGPDTERIQLNPGTHYMEITDDLTFDSKISYSDLTGTSTADLVISSITAQEASLDLNTRIWVSGVAPINGLTDTTLEINFTGDAFGMGLDLGSPDPKDHLRSYIPIGTGLGQIEFVNFGNFLNFKDMTASSFLGQIKQLGSWLDSVRGTDLFTVIDIPFSENPLSDVLDFEDLIQDALLYDDVDGVLDNGDDIAKLLDLEDGSLVPSFANVQELAEKLHSTGLNLLDATIDGTPLNWDSGNDVLTYDIHISHDLSDVEVPIDFDLDLSPLLNINSDSMIRLDATAGLQITLGLDMGAGGDLTSGTTLAELEVSPKTLPAITAENGVSVSKGRLSKDAVFVLDVDGAEYEVTVTRESTRINTTFAQLATDINTALANAYVVGSGDPGTTEDLTDRITAAYYIYTDGNGIDHDRMKLENDGTPVTAFSLSVSSGIDPTITEIGFLQNQDDVGGTIESENDLRSNVGRLSDTASFTVTVTGEDAIPVTLSQDDTAANRTIIDLVNDINRALAPYVDSGTIADFSPGSDVTFNVSLDGNAPIAVTIYDAYTVLLGITDGQTATGTLTAANPLPGTEPGVDVMFDLVVGTESHYVKLSKSATDGNASNAELIDDLQHALAIAGISASDVTVGIDGSNYLTFTADPGTQLTINSHGTNDNIDVNDLVEDINNCIKAIDDLSGKIKAESQGTDQIKLKVTSTAVNRVRVTSGGAFALPTDETSTRVEASAQGNKIVLTPTYDMGVTLSGANNVAQNEMGFSAASQTSNDHDLIIYLSDSSVNGGKGYYEVILDTATDIGDVISLITNSDVTAEINEDGTGLNLIDNTFPDPDKVIFRVEATNGSPAAYQLGIAGADPTADQNDPPDGIDADDGDGVINGGAIGGTTLTDRFFVENADLSADFTLDTPATQTPSLDIDGTDDHKVSSSDPDFDFSSDHIGTYLDITGGTNFTPGRYRIIDVQGNVATLDGDAGDPGASGGTGQIKGIQASATFGIAGIALVGSGTLTGEISTGLQGEGSTDKLTLGELIAGLGDIETIVEEPTYSGSGNLTLDVIVYPDLPLISLGATPQLILNVSNLGDVFTETPPTINVNFSDVDLSQLAKFEHLTFDDILTVLSELISLVNNIEGFDLFSKEIPLINMSVNDLISFAGKFQTALDELQSNPAGTLQALEQAIENAFGIAAGSPHGLDLSLDGDKLKFNFEVGIDFNQSLPVEIPGFLDLGDLSIPGLDGSVGLGGSADLAAEGSLEAVLDFGVDLSPGDPAHVGDLYIYDTTGFDANLAASGNDLSFWAALGPLGLFIQNHPDHDSEVDITGSFNVDMNAGTPRPFDDVADDPAAYFTATIGGTIDGTLPVYFPREDSYIGNITINGDLEDIDNFVILTDAGQTPPAAGTAIVLDAVDVLEAIMDFDFEKLFSIFDSILLGVDGLEGFFEQIYSKLNDWFGQLELPVIGDVLNGAADFIQDFIDDVIDPIRDALESVKDFAKDMAVPSQNIVSYWLYEILDPVLKDLDPATITRLENNFGTGEAGDYKGAYDNKIALSTNLDDYLDDEVEMAETFMQWNMAIGDTYTVASDWGFDIGLPALGLESDGEISVSLDWDIDLGFGISFEDGFYFDVEDPNELFVNVEVELGDTSLTGTLGFLSLTASTDEESTRVGLALEADIGEKDASGDDAKKLTFTELGSIELDFGLAAAVEVDLDMILELAGDVVGAGVAAGFPSLGASFVLDWGIDDGITDYDWNNPEESGFADLSDVAQAAKDGLHLVEFTDIYLDLGSYVSDVLGPIVGKVKEFTEPIQPLVDFLTTPFPVVDKLGFSITPLDLAAAYGSFDPGLIYAIADIISLINSIPDPDTVGSLQLELGDLTLFDDGTSADGTGSVFTGIDLWNPNLNPQDALDTIVDNASQLLTEVFGDNWFSDTLGTIAGEVADIMGGLTEEAGAQANPWAFPILEDPMQVFGLLMGRPAVLVTYDMPKLEFEFEWSQFFSIWGPLGVSINVEFGAEIDFAFGYDTLGIQEFVESDFTNPLLLFDGFYISDTDLPTGDFGTDVPELKLTGGLWAAAEVNLVVARAGVGGGVFIEIDFDLYDPDRDGRVRIKELVGNVVNEWNYGTKALAPLAIFDVHGEITAEFFAFLKIDLFFWEVDKRWDIVDPITLYEFDIPFTRPPNLATELGDGDLQLNMGEYADQRLNYNTEDGDEHFTVTGGAGGTVTVSAFGFSQDYKCTGTLFARMGEGNDHLDVSGVTSAIKYDIEGGAGNDVFDMGTASAPGAAIIYGNAGDDTIWGGSGNDIIYGLQGNDTIYGGGGNDIIFGDDGRIGNDSITASFDPNSDGNDTIYGGGGNDIIFGSGGADTIYGDSDTGVSGGSDNDIIIGDGGKLLFNDEGEDKTVDNVDEIKRTQSDRLDPKGGNDTLIGSAGADKIYGGTGWDTIDGGAGNDYLYGEEGNDTIYGGSDTDYIYGDIGGDTIHGGLGVDPQDSGTDGTDYIYGDEGRDTIYGDGDADEIYGGAGADIIYGDDIDGGLPGDDYGDDTIYGEGEPDTIYGGYGDDTIDGGVGSDIIYGENGPADHIAGTGSTFGGWNPKVYGPNIPLDYDIGVPPANPPNPTLSEGPWTPPPDLPDANDTIYVSSGCDFVDGQIGNDTYICRLEGADNSGFINVYDSGEDVAETDYMQVFGTMYDDTFLLRKSSSVGGLAFVALINKEPYVERINYWNMERMLINCSFGDDHVAVDDVGAETTIDGGVGEDTFQVGQLYRSTRGEGDYDYNHVETEDVFATIETTVGWLSDGINRPMTIYGGVGNDYFTVFHNKAVLSLFGEDGDDTFLIKAFALAGSQEPIRERTDVSGGAGVDLVQYAMNAPVNIDGGDGFDTVIIIGTEFGDDFIVTKDGVYGAGLNVNFVNIESLSVDGAEGDDRFYVMSTSEKFITQIFGGLGSDTFNMSGDTPPVISNDLKGHSGIITHSVENTGTNYDDIKIAGISANVSDNDSTNPTVVISEPDPSVVVTEGGSWDYYDIVLSKSPDPGEELIVQVMAPVQTQDQKERESKAFAVFSWTAVNITDDWTSLSLSFDDLNWFTPQRVYVGAPNNNTNPDLDYDDDALEGPATGFINHMVTSPTGIQGNQGTIDSVTVEVMPDGNSETVFTINDPNPSGVSFADAEAGYMLLITDGPGAGESLRIKEVVSDYELRLYRKFRFSPDSTSIFQIRRDIEAVRSVEVLVHDNDEAGVIITETDGSTEIFEGGDSDDIQVRLTRQPAANVTVNLLSEDGQLSFSDSSLEFTPSNYATAQTVTVTAVNDSVREGFHHGLIKFTVSSPDPGGDTDKEVAVSPAETIILTTEEAYVGLKHRPVDAEVDWVKVDGVTRNADLYDVISNKVVFYEDATQEEFEFLTGTIEVQYDYLYEGYDELEVTPLLTDIADNNVAQVKITETGGSTDVIEDGVYTGTATATGEDTLTDSGASFPNLSGYFVQITDGLGAGQVREIDSNTATVITVSSEWDDPIDDTSEYAVILPAHSGVPWTDTYEVVLTQVPDGNVEINVTPEITKTSAGRIIHWGKQVAVSSSAPGAVNNDDGTVTLSFTPSNWNTPQTIEVTAVDDLYYDGDDTQVFAPELHTVGDIQGPLYLYGADGYGSILAFEPTMLHYELNIMPETGDVLEVGVDGTTITVYEDPLLDALNELNANLMTLQDLVDEQFTVTIAEGITGYDGDDDPIYIKEIGQFRMIVDAVLGDYDPDEGDHKVTLTLNLPWELAEDETFDMITKYTLTQMSPNFFAVEEEQIDYLFVYNEDSPADNEIPARVGLLTDSTIVAPTPDYDYANDDGIANSIVEKFVTQMDGKHLSGFGMGSDMKIGGYWHPRGITYGDMEVVEINLGLGIDVFSVEDTHIRADGFQTWTIINTGGGEDDVTVLLDSDVAELHSGMVTSAGDTTLTDTSATFPETANQFGLKGYIVEITGGTGVGQRRVIDSNTTDTLTVKQAWDVALDTTSTYRVMGAELFTGQPTGWSDVTLVDTGQTFPNGGLVGCVVEIIDGSGTGAKREIISNTDHELTVSSSWGEEEEGIDGTSEYRIYGDHDGPVSINTQAGDDTLDGSGSTIPLVMFGGAGDDVISGGTTDDIIFGDRGEVDYINEEGKTVTLLGRVREKIDPQYVTDAGADYLVDSEANFPVESIDHPGLEGLMVSITDGAGFRQDPRLIKDDPDNTGIKLWVSPDWDTELNPDPGGTFDPGNPDENPSKYRISLIPEDQTDGVVRDPSRIIAIDETIGGDDTIVGNAGNDRIFGGLSDDTINGNTGDDIIFGDHGRLDYTPETVGNVDEGPALGDVVPATLWRIRTTFDDIGGADTVYGDQHNDIILGGFNPNEMDSEDNLFGNTDDDIIVGDNGLLKFSPNAVTTNDPRDVLLDLVQTIALDTGGADIISGNAGDDMVLGGTAGDTIHGDDATASAGMDDGEDILIGDNGEILLTENVIGRLNAFGSGVNLIQTTDTTDATGGSDTIEGDAAADIILGGVNGDVLYGDAATSVAVLDGDDVILGDNGVIDFENGDSDPTSLDLIQSLAYSSVDMSVLGGVDTIAGNAGNDTIMGGTYGDTMYGDDTTASAGNLDGEDILLGDNADIWLSGHVSGRLYALGSAIEANLRSAINLITTTDDEEATGGGDTIEGNAATDVIFGGVNNEALDVLYGDAAISVPALDGDDVILGDNGWLDFEDSDTDSSTLDLVHSEAYASGNITVLGGDDTISGNAGNDTIIGGTYDDTMYGDDATASADDGDGEDIMLGDNADITLSGHGTGRLYILNSIVSVIDTTDYETRSGGQDTASGNASIDFIAGGVDRDTIYGDAASPDAQYDGDDYILGDNGMFEFELGQDDVSDLGRPDVLAYLGGTTLSLDPDPTTLDRVMITDPTLGDDDTIHGDAGNDTIFGGTGRDTIWGDSDMDNQVDNATDGDGTDIIFGDHAKIYPHLPNVDSFFINNNFFSINTSEDDGFDTDGVVEYAPGTDFEDIIFGSGNDDTIIGGQDDDILFGGADNDILIGGHNVVGGHDEMDDMDTASIEAILPDELADLDSSDVNDINDVMDGGSQNDVMLGDNAIIIRQNALTDPVDSTSPRYQLLTEDEIYTMVTENMGGLFDIDVGFSPNIQGDPQLKPGSNVGYTIILLNHTEATQTLAAQNPADPRVFGNDVMAGGSEDDEMFGQLGDDIMQGDGSIDMVSDTTGWQMPDGTTAFNPSPAVDPSFIIPDNQATPTRFMVEGNYLLFHSDEAGTDGDDYMEGNAGNDRMYGNLGQDDMIGGNSTLFGLDEATAQFYGMQPDDFPRPDGADLIYGGAGDPDRLARNAEIDPATGDEAVPADQNHGRDADVVLGDNGNIYRLVQVDGETEYLTFNYDQITAGKALTDGYSTDRPIIPRAVEFLDYAYSFTFDGTEVSATFAGVGYGDLIYGETGDDIIHGMTGDDALFGNGDDDDLYGEVGNDWISGGTGEDGILGDDGLIKTSRNTEKANNNDTEPSEPLYGIAKLDEVDLEISTPGNLQRAIINVEDALKKTVDLISFNLEGDGIPVNDILYGGLGSDWIHAGQGDDAMSGGEALPFYYTNETIEGLTANQLLQIQQEAPVNPGLEPEPNPFWFDFAPYNPGDILRYEGNTAADSDDPHGKTKQEFALYDEFFPRRKVMLDVNGEAVALAADAVYDFLLNFNEDEGPLGYHYLGDDEALPTDGDDRMFGDLGNDWMVGGTGRDHMYGGRGDDLLNMDDDHDSGPGGKYGPHDPDPDALDNRASDEYQAYADIVYAGAGRDIMILNTGADRAIDWVGEYNSYIVPFAPFGAFHISRTLQPQVPEFLCALSESDGIDTSIPDGARYVEQKTVDVRVDDPSALENAFRNGEPYGELGMVRQTDYDWFNQTGAPNDPQPGNLQGKREIMRRELFTDSEPSKHAFAKGKGDWAITSGKLEAIPVMLGEETVSIYHLDQVQPGYMEILVTVNADKDIAGWNSNAYIIFDYQSANNFKFAGIDVGLDKLRIGHRTPDGWVIDVQANMQLKPKNDYDLVVALHGTVATLYVDLKESVSFDFGDPLNDGYLGLGTDNSVARFDDWQVQKLPPTFTFALPEDFPGTSPNPFEEQMGVWIMVGDHYVGASEGADRAITTWDLEVAVWTRLEFEAIVETDATGGLIFDYYSPEDFKFVAIDAIADRVVIGHHTAKGWTIDAETDQIIESGTSYKLGISLLGTSVSVTLDGEAMVGHVFNSLLNDGELGLLSKDGVSAFDDIVARGDDPAYASEDAGESLTASTKTLAIMNLPVGWSMISLPVIPDNPAVSALFPDAVVVYEYEKELGYVRADAMEVGKGYWVLFDEPQSYGLTGQPIQTNTLSAQSGWDMIGGGAYSAEVLVDHGNKIDVIYEYVPGMGYQRVPESENLKPGKGYWIRQSPIETESTLTEDALSPIVDEAIARWTEAVGGDDTMVAALPEVTFQIVDLEDLTLGRAIEDTVLIDIDAGGHGWFVDETPHDNVEFDIELGDGEMLATADSEAYGQMDLLTAVMHELGHVLGLGHSDNQGLMAESLDAGVRRLPAESEIAALSLDGDGALEQALNSALNGDSTFAVRGKEIQDSASNLVVMDVFEEPDEGYSLEATVAPTHQSPWLRQFLLNAGQSDEVDPNAEIRVVIPRDEDI